MVKKYLEYDPKSYDFNLLLGRIYRKKDDIKEAISIYEKLSDIYPSDAEIKHELAEVYFIDRDFTNALLNANLYLVKNSKDYSTLVIKAKSLKYLGRFKEACKIFTELIENYDNWELLMFDYVFCLENLNKFDHAIEELKEYLEKYPKSKKAKDKIEELKKKKEDKEANKAINSDTSNKNKNNDGEESKLNQIENNKDVINTNISKVVDNIINFHKSKEDPKKDEKLKKKRVKRIDLTKKDDKNDTEILYIDNDKINFEAFRKKVQGIST